MDHRLEAGATLFEKTVRACSRSRASNRAATVRERLSHLKPDRFLTGAALKETS